MYSSNSPYSKTPIKGDYLDIMNPKFIIRDESDESYVIESKYEMRPDLLSHKLFDQIHQYMLLDLTLVSFQSVIDQFL